MASEHQDWTVPGSLRALLWWPPLAFVVPLLDPSAPPVTIAIIGALLALLGVAGAAVGRVLGRRMAAHLPDGVGSAQVVAAVSTVTSADQQAA